MKNDIIARARELIANAGTYAGRRAQLEADLNEKLSATSFALDAKTIAQHRDAAAGLALARQIERPLADALETMRRELGAFLQRTTDQIENAHRKIDAAIGQRISDALPPELRGVTIDARETPIARAEAAARFVPQIGGSAPPPHDATIADRAAALADVLKRWGKIEAELARCQSVLAKFPTEKAAA